MFQTSRKKALNQGTSSNDVHMILNYTSAGVYANSDSSHQGVCELAHAPDSWPRAHACPTAQVVHSRTFGSAARKGGVGVRMLVPLVDMLNHGGDEAQQHLSGAVVATDNVRCELFKPLFEIFWIKVKLQGNGWECF